MKIIAFNWRDRTHPEGGGAEENIHMLGSGLIKKGHEFHLICGKYKGSKKFEVINGVNIHRIGGRFSIYILAPLYYLYKFRKKKPDLIIDDINGIPFFTPLFSRKPKLAIFHHKVGDIFNKELPFPANRIGRFIEDKIIPFLYKNTKFVTVSNSSKIELIDLGIKESSIDIVYNGVDTERYSPGIIPKSNHPTLIYLGRLKKYKRVDVLLRSINELKQKGMRVKLEIVGQGDDEKRLKDLREELGIDDIVKFHGFINEESKLQLLRQSWLFIMPSEKEGWGITSIEANACGIPVIAFNVPGLRDSVKHGISGILVETEEEFIQMIEKCIVDQDLLMNYSEGARKWSLQFDWSRSVDRLEDIIGQLNKETLRNN